MVLSAGALAGDFVRISAPGLSLRVDNVQVSYAQRVLGVEAADLMVNGLGSAGVQRAGNDYAFDFSSVVGDTASVGWRASSGITDLARQAASPCATVVNLTRLSTTEVIMDDGTATYTGSWTASSTVPGNWGAGYRHDGAAGKGTKTAEFRPSLPTPGFYQVYEWHNAASTRATNVPVTVIHAAGSDVIRVNQQTNGGQWVLLGIFPFQSGTNGAVRINNEGTVGYVIADGVRFVHTGASLPEISAAPTSLAFHCGEGETPAAMPLEVWNSGGGVLNYVLTPGAGWIRPAVLAGQSTGERDTVAITCATAGLAPGVHRGTLSLTSGLEGQAPLVVAVTLTIDASSAEIIVDDADVSDMEFAGQWASSTSIAGYWGQGYRHDGAAQKGTCSALFRPTLPDSGYYEVHLWYSSSPNRSTNTPVEMVGVAGTNTVAVNQRLNGAQWNLLGTFPFLNGTNGFVRVRNNGTVGYVVADAVRFVPTGTPLAQLSVSASFLGIRGMAGRHSSAVISLRNTINSLMNYQVAGEAAWLHPQTTSGTTTGEWDKIVLDLDASSLAPGTYSSTLTITAPGALGAPKSIKVTFWVEPAVPGVIVDDSDSPDASFAGSWATSAAIAGYWGSGYRHDLASGKGTKIALFRPNLATSRNYDVFLWYASAASRATNVPVNIQHAQGVKAVLVNQQEKGVTWTKLGTFPFNAGTNGWVEISNASDPGYVVADAVRFAPSSSPVTLESGDRTAAVESGTWSAVARPQLTWRWVDGGGLEVSWSSQPGVNYTLSEGGQPDGPWKPLVQWMGDGTVLRQVIKMAAEPGSLFLRVTGDRLAPGTGSGASGAAFRVE